MNQKFKIDEQLRDLFPPLTKEEYEQLEINIIRDGCREPIATWNEYIVDGHNRYSICNKHNIEFQSFILGYDTKEEVIQWMIDTQLGRRNLTPIQRVAIAEKYRPVLKKLAEENKQKAMEQARKENPNNANEQLWQKSSKTVEPIHTRDELAKIAGVSHDTYGKAKKILDYEKEKEDKKEELSEKEKRIIDDVKTGEKKVNTGFNELFDKPKSEVKKANVVSKKEERLEIPEEIMEYFLENDFFCDCGGRLKYTDNSGSLIWGYCYACDRNYNFNEKDILEDYYKDKNKLSKKCLKCGIIKDISNFDDNIDFCNDCLEVINNPIQKVEDYSKLSQEEQEVIRGMKTEKLVSDYLIVSDELLSIKDNIKEQIDIADNRIFDRYNLPELMTIDDKNNAIVYMDEIIQEVNNLKNKLKNIIIKENN